MMVVAILAIGIFATLSGIVRLALVARSYHCARRNSPEGNDFDRERALTLAITSVTAIITGTLLVYIGLLLEGALVF